jgi:hypothetical protein
MWMDFGCETSFVPEMPETSQHFFYGVIRPGLADKRKRGKLFFKIFQKRDMNLKLASLTAHLPLLPSVLPIPSAPLTNLDGFEGPKPHAIRGDWCNSSLWFSG